MGRFVIVALVVAVLLGAAMVFLPPSAGQWVYDHAGPAEASLYGFHTERVDVGDIRFDLFRGGAGAGKPVLVLIHGYSADRLVWPRFARHLVDRYEILIPDLAGHGTTGFKPGLDYSGPAQARRVVRMLDKLGIQRAHVAGNSMGGFITAHIGVSYPDRVLSLTLLDAAGVVSPEPSDLEKMLAQGKNPFLVETVEDFPAFYAMSMARPPPMPPFVLAGIAERYVQRKDELAVIGEAIISKDMLDTRLGDIHAPTLVIWGNRDRLLHVSMASVFGKGIPGAKVEILDGVGHMPMVEVPDETAAIVGAFLEGLSVPDSP